MQTAEPVAKALAVIKPQQSFTHVQTPTDCFWYLLLTCASPILLQLPLTCAPGLCVCAKAIEQRLLSGTRWVFCMINTCSNDCPPIVSGVRDFDPPKRNYPQNYFSIRVRASSMFSDLRTLIVLQFDGHCVFHFGNHRRRPTVQEYQRGWDGTSHMLRSCPCPSLLHCSKSCWPLTYNPSVAYHSCERVKVLSVRVRTAGLQDCCSLHTAKALKPWQRPHALESAS